MYYTIVIELIIFSCLSNLVNAFVFYPLLIWILARFAGKKVNSSYEYQPKITIIISAYNEENDIKEAVESIYKSGYPTELIKVLVGSDGSTDDTIKALEQAKELYPEIEYFDFPRSGKNKVLNMLVPKAETDIIFYMDADIRVKRGTLTELVSKFADDSIGAVISSMISLERDVNDTAGREGESLYQIYETQIRVNESRIQSTVNSLGALYGIKKEHYSPLPNDLVCDDLMPLYFVALNKKRVIFDQDSLVYEVRQKTLKAELSRRVRMASGGMATVWHARKLMLPSYGWVSFFLGTHKVLRWFAPIFIIGIALGTLLLPSDSLVKEPLLIAQAIFYVSALIGWILEQFDIKFYPFRIMLYFVTMNLGFLLGIFKFLSKKNNAMWEKI